MCTTENLVNDLKKLKGGHGLNDPDLDQLVGRCLRTACGVGPVAPPEELRRVVGRTLRRHAARLPDNQRLAVLAAFALLPGIPGDAVRFEKQRMAAMLAKHFPTYSGRTADRWCQEGIQRLAQRLAAERPNRFVPGEWHTAELWTTIRLDTIEPEIHERRRVVAGRDGLDTVTVSFTLSRSGAADDPTKLFLREDGSDLEREMIQVVPGHYQADIALPGPLRADDSAEYSVVMLPRPADGLLPFCALNPLRPCERFELTVQFDPDHLPAEVWLINGTPPGAARAARDERLWPDEHGRVNRVWENPTERFSWGIRWVHANDLRGRPAAS